MRTLFFFLKLLPQKDKRKPAKCWSLILWSFLWVVQHVASTSESCKASLQLQSFLDRLWNDWAYNSIAHRFVFCIFVPACFIWFLAPKKLVSQHKLDQAAIWSPRFFSVGPKIDCHGWWALVLLGQKSCKSIATVPISSICCRPVLMQHAEVVQLGPSSLDLYGYFMDLLDMSEPKSEVYIYTCILRISLKKLQQWPWDAMSIASSMTNPWDSSEPHPRTASPCSWLKEQSTTQGFSQVWDEREESLLFLEFSSKLKQKLLVTSCNLWTSFKNICLSFLLLLFTDVRSEPRSCASRRGSGSLRLAIISGGCSYWEDSRQSL